MSFILRSPKFVSSVLRYYRHASVVRLRNEVSRLQKQNIIPIKYRLTKEFSTPAPKVDESHVLNKYLDRLNSCLSVRQCVSIQDVYGLLEVVKLSGSVNEPQSLLILKCCCNLSPDENPHEKIKLTNEVWRILEGLGTQFNISHYNTLLKAYLDYGYKFSPNKFLNDLESADILPDIFTYTRLLKVFCQLGDITGASNLLEKMKNENFPINEDIFNSLVYGHCQINDLESAKGIILLMKNKGIHPSSETYGHLMCFHAKRGEIDEVEKILSENEDDIFFSDKDLLNVLYVLAENGYSDHIDKILRRLKKSVGYNVYATDIVHRLLHKKLDSEAIKVFTTLKEAAFRFRENFMIENISKTRTCEEIIEFCEKLEKEEVVSSTKSILDGLRETLRYRNVSTILEFFAILNKKGIPVESHYFWPLLIKVSKDGNNSILDVLSKIRKMGAPISTTTYKKIVLPNFNFDSSWKQQIEKLNSVFVHMHLISSHLLYTFLKNGDLKAAEELVAEKAIVYVPRSCANNLVACLKTSGDVDSFIRILYCLFHDFTLQQSVIDADESTEDLSPDIDLETGSFEKRTLNFDTLMKWIFENLLQECDENILLSVLKGMLEKKIGLSSNTSDLICSKFDSPAVVDIVKQLTPDLKPELDENIISKKQKCYTGKSKLSKEFGKAIQSEDLEKVLMLWEENKKDAGWPDILRVLGFIVKHNVEKGLEIYKEACTMPDKESDDLDKYKAFRVVLASLASKDDIENMKKAFEIGLQANFLTENNFEILIRKMLQSNKIEMATDLFCEATTKFNKVLRYSNLVLKLIEDRNTESLEKVTNAVTNLWGEQRSLMSLMFHFAAAGQVRQVQKLLEIYGSNISLARLRRECAYFFKLNSITFFETLLAATKSFPGSYRKIPFQYLYYMYILNGHEEKAKNLWLQIETENDPQYLPLLREIERYFKNEEVFDSPHKKINIHKENLQKLISQDRGKDNEFDLFQHNPSDKLELTSKAINLALEDQVEEFSKLANRYRSYQLNKGVTNYFIDQGKLDMYLTFLQKALNKKLFIPVFCSDEMLRALLANKNLVEKFKDVAYKCKETGMTKPLHYLWEYYMFAPENREKAEELYKNSLFDRKLCNFERLLDASSYLNDLNAFNTVIDSDLFKSIPSLKPHRCYSQLIKHYTQKDLDKALSYLEKAVNDNYGGSIDKDVLVELATSVKESGRDFPYEDLLNKKQSQQEQ